MVGRAMEKNTQGPLNAQMQNHKDLCFLWSGTQRLPSVARLTTLYDVADQRPEARDPRAVPQPAVLNRRDSVAVAWHRCKHRDFHADRSNPVTQAAGQEPGRARDVVPAGAA